MSQNTTNKSQAEQTFASLPSYALFAGHYHHPIGGIEDFKASSNSIEELKSLYEKNANEWSREVGSYADPWGHIADIRTMKLIAEAETLTKWNESDKQ